MHISGLPVLILCEKLPKVESLHCIYYILLAILVNIIFQPSEGTKMAINGPAD